MIMPRPRQPEEPIRSELVARIRHAIQQGCYDTPEKLEIALLRLLADMGEEGDDPDPSLGLRTPESGETTPLARRHRRKGSV